PPPRSATPWCDAALAGGGARPLRASPGGRRRERDVLLRSRSPGLPPAGPFPHSAASRAPSPASEPTRARGGDGYASARSGREVSSRSALAATMAPPTSTAKRALTAAAITPARRPPSGTRFQQSA